MTITDELLRQHGLSYRPPFCQGDSCYWLDVGAGRRIESEDVAKVLRCWLGDVLDYESQRDLEAQREAVAAFGSW